MYISWVKINNSDSLSLCEITNAGKVSYIGDTFRRIRSSKHDTSNAYTHAFDV